MVEVALKPLEKFDVNPNDYPPLAVPQYKTTSLNDFLTLRGEMIRLSIVATGAGVNDIYTVPDGYTLFIVSASIASVINSAGGPTLYFVYLRSQNSGSNSAILAYHIYRQADTAVFNNLSQTLSPVIPLKYNEKSNLYLYQQASFITTDATIQGYLIKNEEIPQIF
jgi:hypothetical protein